MRLWIASGYSDICRVYGLPDINSREASAVLFLVEEVTRKDQFVRLDQAVGHFFKKYRVTDDTARATIVVTLQAWMRHERTVRYIFHNGQESAQLPDIASGICILYAIIGAQPPAWAAKKWKEAWREGLAAARNIPEIWLSLHTDWAKRLEAEIGTDWISRCKAFLNEPQHFARINTLKVRAGECIEHLASEGVEAAMMDGQSEESIRLFNHERFFRSKAYLNGWVEKQDLSSQQVSRLLDPKPGSRVLDRCAGAGGKTLHLAAIMKNRGRIIACDAHEGRLKELVSRMRRAGVTNVQVVPENELGNLPEIDRMFDYILIDAPCSGTGVFARNPESRLRYDEKWLSKLIEVQATLLNDGWDRLKPGGALVYSVCSILPSEGEGRIRSFLQSHPEASQEDSRYTEPGDGDGFFMARIVKNKV